MRFGSDDRKLCVDAICIDQANREERNHQVQMMRGIYADVSGVLVWLGPSKQGSDLIFKVKHDKYLSQVFDHSWGTSPSAETKAFLALLSRTYWHRVWVQQELLLARRYTIHCGGGQIDDVDLTYLMSKIPKRSPDYMSRYDDDRHEEPYYTKIRESHAFNVITIKERKISVPALSKLGAWIQMNIRANLQTSERRDVIYAMLGISSDCMNGEIVPDYGKPVLNIYREVLQLCGAQSASLTFQHQLARKLGLEHGEICNTVKSAVCQWW